MLEEGIKSCAMKCQIFYKQFSVLTWKNWILRRRNLKSWLIEVSIPILLTLALLGMRNTVHVTTVGRDISAWERFTSFDAFYQMFKTPQCTYYDANIFWRCGMKDLCDPMACERLHFAFAPVSASDIAAKNAARMLRDTFNSSYGGTIPSMLFPSEYDLDSFVKQPEYGQKSTLANIGVAIVFDSGPPSWQYHLRLNHTVKNGQSYLLPPTDLTVDPLLRSASDTPKACSEYCWSNYLDMYYTSGALAVQNYVDSHIASRTAGKPVHLNANFVDFPSEGYSGVGFWATVSTFYGVWIVIGVLYAVSNLIRNLVIEKEQRIREGMRMMAMQDVALFSSWAFHAATTFTIMALGIVAVGAGKLFQYSDKGLVFLYYILFFYSTIAFAFWMSTFFSKSKTAAVLGLLPYFVGFFITMAIKPSAARSSKLAACLHPCAAFGLAMSAFAEYEDAGIGVTKYTWRTSATSNFAFSDALGMMLWDIFFYWILTWYFEKVWPNQFGVQLRPWFLLTKSYWQSVCPNLVGHARPAADIDVEEALLQEASPDVERVPEILAQQIRDGKCILIRDLNKEFQTNTGIKNAVDHLNLTMYSNQITALLGHNGAGKSTTISILTGLIGPSSGVALINGKDINRDMTEIRHSLGVCPQHDVLFADLTVEEHLILFAAFKGVARGHIASAVEDMIVAVGLTEKRKVFSKNLSGGMKRKLSVGIAFIGGSKVVFLDEPTSGMDPFSRRFTWNVIRKYKENRTIILTTHFLDEADMLGDRVAIMNKGKLRACGSSLFLKNHFGVGYTLTIEKIPQADSRRIKHFVQSRINTAKVLSSVGAEVSFQLPTSSSGLFRGLFEGLDEHKDSLGLETYGISVTTLEEVFIRVTRGDETDAAGKAGVIERRNTLEERRNSMEEKKEQGRDKDNDNAGPRAPAGDGLGQDGLHVDYSDGWNFFQRHMYALFLKRFLYWRKDKKAWAYEFLIPPILVLIGCFLMLFADNGIVAKKLPDLTLSTSVYNPGITTDRLPVPYNAEGHAFSASAFNNTDDSAEYLHNPNVTGQSQILSQIPSATSLPLVPLVAPKTWNMSLALLNTRKAYRASRYGAFSFENVSQHGGLTSDTYTANIHANYTGVHSAPIYANMLNNAILRSYDPAASITVVMKPLAITTTESSTAGSFNGFPVVMMVMEAFSFIPAAFASFVVRERETKAKHLQIVSGVSFLSYWLSTFLFDFGSFHIPMLLTVILLVAFKVQSFTGHTTMGWVILLFELWGLSTPGFTYMLSFAFKSPSVAQITVIMLYIVLGTICPILTITLSLVSKETRKIAKGVRPILRIFPPYALGDALMNIAYIDVLSMLNAKNYEISDMDITLADILYMLVGMIVFFIGTLLIEYLVRRPAVVKFFNKDTDALHRGVVDVDVAQEEQRLKVDTGDTIQIKDMTKVYTGGKMAVRGISLGIPNGECFGLLGINGAGKTTTLSILTAEFPQSTGIVRLGGYDISQNPDVVRRLVGYCPQFDALFDLLTGREHLELYARVKGLSEPRVKDVVEQKIREMDLTEYADRNASTYSGGNKRKLSVAMAMIGKPLIVFLDEPSTGMDPVARRFMWQVISDITSKRGECCIILTTHSMEECEALCTRIGIMVGGRLRCLGPAQRLKSRFGMGYQLEFAVKLPTNEDRADYLKAMQLYAGSDGRFAKSSILPALEAINHADWDDNITPTGSGADVYQSVQGNGTIGAPELASWCKLEERVQAVMAFMQREYSDSTLRERQGAKVRYEIPSKDSQGQARRLSSMFGVIEDSKHRLCIEDYSVSQTSLEQIFNYFAAQQEEETGPAAGVVKHQGQLKASSSVTSPRKSSTGKPQVVPL